MAPSSSSEQQHHHLLLFDFDHTVCDGNTDTWILRALPPLEGRTTTSDGNAGNAAATTSPRATCLPPHLRNPRDPNGWTAYMQTVFDYAHDATGVGADDFRRALRSLPLTAGFGRLLNAISEADAMTISAGIISDSNSLYIPWTLEANGFEDPSRLFLRGVHTNPATLCAEGRRLTVRPHETSPHGCALACPPNMCKGKRVRAIAGAGSGEGGEGRSRPKGLRVAFVGDGGNDFCAAASLQRGDAVFARRGMRLDRLLMEQEEQQKHEGGSSKVVVAEVVRWDSGDEILEWLRTNWGVLC